jgi:Tfp pilus assembly protein PilX
MKHLTGRVDRQKGVTLVIAMVMLIVLMLLGISAMTASGLMSRLAGNLQFQNEAKYRAENALVAGESLLLTGTNSQNNAFSTPGSATAALPFYDPTAVLSPLSSWPAASYSVDAAGTQQYIIQLISSIPSPPAGQQITSMGGGGGPVTPTTNYYLFRVTAKGTSVRGATRLVESIVQVPAP